MSKIKTIEHDSEAVAKFLEWSGMVLMTAATLTGLAELPNYLNNRVAVLRPEVALVSQTANINNPLLRERDESTPQYITFNVNRTASRSGKR